MTDYCDSTRCADEAERVEILERNYAAMVRLMLSVEWSGMRWDRSGGVVCCPVCTAARGAAARHADGCDLVAVLRAAGVLTE